MSHNVGKITNGGGGYKPETYRTHTLILNHYANTYYRLGKVFFDLQVTHKEGCVSVFIDVILLIILKYANAITNITQLVIQTKVTI